VTPFELTSPLISIMVSRSGFQQDRGDPLAGRPVPGWPKSNGMPNRSGPNEAGASVIVILIVLRLQMVRRL